MQMKYRLIHTLKHTCSMMFMQLDTARFDAYLLSLRSNMHADPTDNLEDQPLF